MCYQLSSKGGLNKGLAYNQAPYSSTSKALRAQYNSTRRMIRYRKTARMSKDVVLIMVKKEDGQVN